MLEMTLGNIVLRNNLVPDAQLAIDFIKYNFIFVNGCLCNNQKFQIFAGDAIQLIISLKYYIIYK